MDQVLWMLKTSPEYAALVEGLNRGESAAVTGVAGLSPLPSL